MAFKEVAPVGSAPDTPQFAKRTEVAARIPAAYVRERVPEERRQQYGANRRVANEIVVALQGRNVETGEDEIRRRAFKRTQQLREKIRPYRVIRIDEKDSLSRCAAQTLVARPGKATRIGVLDNENLDVKPLRRSLYGLTRARKRRTVARVARNDD